MKKNIARIVSSSFGKDSCAMIIRMVKEGIKFDEVVFFDTGDEFQAIYNVIDWFRDWFKEIGLNAKITILQPDETFEQLMYEHKINKRNGETQEGYSWCGGNCRWMTSQKIQGINRYYKSAYPDTVIVEYIGYAADEAHRIDRTRPGNTIQIYPLVEWGMKESECLELCRKNGVVWGENGLDLYSILTRVSCKKCGNKGLGELRNLYRNCPDYWEELRQAQLKTNRPYKGIGVFELEKRFQQEIETEMVPVINFLEMV